MNFSYSIEIIDPVVFITVEGNMDQLGAISIIEAFTADKAYQAHFGVCFDVRNNNYLPSYTEISSFYHEYRIRFRTIIKGKVAFIVNSKIQYGIARMASTILSSMLPHMEVFLSKDEGIRWLRS